MFFFQNVINRLYWEQLNKVNIIYCILQLAQPQIIVNIYILIICQETKQKFTNPISNFQRYSLIPMMRNYHVLFSEENQINIFFYYISHVRNVT